MTDSTLQSVSVVIPVHKENPDVVTSIATSLEAYGAEVIVVDDGQTMDWPDEYNILSYVPHMGYGYAIKRGIEYATRPYVMTLDGDGQHSVEDAIKLWKAMELTDDFDMIVGMRWNIEETPIRWIGRKGLNFLGSLISGHYLVDLNSGMRIFKRKLATAYSQVLCDTFSFTTSLTMCMVTDGCKVVYFPINVKPRAFGKSHVKLLRHGFVTLYYIVWIGLALRTRKLRGWLRNHIGSR